MAQQRRIGPNDAGGVGDVIECDWALITLSGRGRLLVAGPLVERGTVSQLPSIDVIR